MRGTLQPNALPSNVIYPSVTSVFYISRLAPGDPLLSYYGERVEKMSVEERAWAEEKLGLSDPIHVQYVRWLENAFHGDFGISFKYKMPATEVIASRVGNTLILGGIGFILVFALSLLLGILCARFEDRPLDKFICKFGTITSCIPEFWMSLMLILIFAIYLNWLPSSGAYSIGNKDDIGDRIVHLILPMSIVVINHLWYYAYMIRNKILEEVRADYVLLAKSKGLSKKQILYGHCLNGLYICILGDLVGDLPFVERECLFLRVHDLPLHCLQLIFVFRLHRQHGSLGHGFDHHIHIFRQAVDCGFVCSLHDVFSHMVRIAFAATVFYPV